MLSKIWIIVSDHSLYPNLNTDKYDLFQDFLFISVCSLYVGFVISEFDCIWFEYRFLYPELFRFLLFYEILVLCGNYYAPPRNQNKIAGFNIIQN